MRLLLAALLLLFSYSASCQTDDNGEEPLVARVLAMDTSVAIAQRFSEAMGSIANGYNLAFIDNERRYTVRYVYKNQKNETLRVDYHYTLESPDGDEKKPKRAVVTLQRISGELTVVTAIYNFIFGASLSPERIMMSSTQGSPVKFMGKNFQFTLLPDDYEAGYWVLTFMP